VSNTLYHRAGILACVIILSACKDGVDPVNPSSRAQDPSTLTPSFAAIPGSTSKLIGRATFSDPHDQNFKVKRMTGDWQVELKAKPAFDIAVQTIDFPIGSASTWHIHPGPVFIQVVFGEMTFYESDDPSCTPIRRKNGETYLDVGDHAHIARNESGAPAQNFVTYLAPPGVPLKTDQPKPGNCPF
jgi:hypothetical protein